MLSVKKTREAFSDHFFWTVNGMKHGLIDLPHTSLLWDRGVHKRTDYSRNKSVDHITSGHTIWWANNIKVYIGTQSSGNNFGISYSLVEPIHKNTDR